VLRGIPEIDKAAPMVVGTETVAAGERQRQMALFGSTHEALEVRRLDVASGRFLPPLEWDRSSPVAVLGQKAARELFPGRSAVGEIVRVGDWRMRVLGVLAPRGQQLGLDMDDVVIVPVATAMKMLNRRSIFRLLLQVRTHADLERAKERIVRLISERHGEEDVTAITQDAVLGALTSILGVLTMALAGIASVSLAVAGVGIMNVMLVSVSERTREIGLLKALGAGRRQILAAFLAEAVLISTSGGLVGLLIGWLAVRALVAVYPALPATPPTWAVAAAFSLSVAVGAAFGVLPARRATRLDPVAALAGR
jgi:putative ABC transport system permease protein